MMDDRERFSDASVLAVLAAIAFFPSIGFVGFDGTSYALGTAAASLLSLAIWSFMARSSPRRIGLSGLHVTSVLLGAIGVMIFQSVAAFSVAEQFDFVRFVGSTGVLLTILAGAYGFSALIDGASETGVKRMLYGVMIALVFMALAGVLGWSLVSDTRFHRPIYIFAEPSHFALVFAPFLLWVAVKCHSFAVRVVLFTVVLFLLFLMKNLTLFLLIGLASLIVLRARALFVVACCLFLLIVSDLDYFIPRIQFIGGTNISVLVWLQGWEEAMIGLRETMGIGLGFQQLGVNGAKGAFAYQIAEQIRILDGVENGALNLLDGGTLAAKLVGELGFLGIGLVGACLYLICGGIRNLKRISAGAPDSSATVFFYCCLVSFSLDLFVRGTGYFSPSVLLFFTGVFGLRRMGRLEARAFIMNQGMVAR